MKASLYIAGLLAVVLSSPALAKETVVNFGSFTCYFQNKGDTSLSAIDPSNSASTYDWTSEQIASVGRCLQTWDNLILNEPGRTLTIGVAWSSSMPENALAGSASNYECELLTKGNTNITWVLTPAEQVWNYGETKTNDDYDIYIVWNDEFYNSFYYGADPNQISYNQFDFESIMLHEVGHGLGFYSVADSDGTYPIGTWKITDNTNGTVTVIDAPCASTFDLLMVDSEGNSILNPGEEAFKIELGETLTLADSGLYVYNPDVYKEGSSFSHVTNDKESNGNADDQGLLMKYATGTGVTNRELSEQEKTIMAAMGWKVPPAPEPSTATLSLLTLAGVLLRRKRKA